MPGWTVNCVGWVEWARGEAMGVVLWFPSWLSSLVLFSFVLIAISVSTGIIRAPPPYRLVNAGSCDYKKKKKKKKKKGFR